MSGQEEKIKYSFRSKVLSLFGWEHPILHRSMTPRNTRDYLIEGMRGWIDNVSKGFTKMDKAWGHIQYRIQELEDIQPYLKKNKW